MHKKLQNISLKLFIKKGNTYFTNEVTLLVSTDMRLTISPVVDSCLASPLIDKAYKNTTQIVKYVTQ